MLGLHPSLSPVDAERESHARCTGEVPCAPSRKDYQACKHLYEVMSPQDSYTGT